MNVLLAGLSTDRVELNLAKSLNEAGIDLTIIAASESPAVTLCQEHGIRHVSHHFSSRIDRRAVSLFRELIPKHRIDLVHNLTNRALATSLSATRGEPSPPKIIAYRGTMGHLSWFDPASHFSYLNRRVDGIICVSDAVRRYLKTFRIADERLEVIWKGHDPSWYTTSPRAALREWNIPDDAVVVNFTGNIRPVKGVDYLLKAFASIKPEENIRLLVVGDVRDPSVRKRMDKYPHVHFAGFRRDATSLAGACDIAVMPSIEREGLPKAVLEAMAQRVPCITTNVGGLPELVEHQVCGLLVPPRNAEAILGAVRMMARDGAMRQRFGSAARMRVEGAFNFRHTVEKTKAFYARMLESK
jgi:glycosyltransferase involved in cell wall biosynthesis